MPDWIDIHTHKIPADSAVTALICVPPGNPERLVGRLCSAVHPWDAGEADAPLQLEYVRSLAEGQSIIALGETGLDSRCDVSLEAQENMFLAQLEIAEQHGLPVLLHAVRTYAELALIRGRRSAPTPWIVHGFTGSAQSASQLVEAGCYISFGAKLLQRHPRHIEALLAIPRERLFVETDETQTPISGIYDCVARLLRCEVVDLQRQIFSNVESIWDGGTW